MCPFVAKTLCFLGDHCVLCVRQGRKSEKSGKRETLASFASGWFGISDYRQEFSFLCIMCLMRPRILCFLSASHCGSIPQTIPVNPAMRIPFGSLVAFATVVCAAPLQTSALPESDAAMGRLIARRFADAIVAIKGTAMVRITMGDRALPPTEQKFDVNGTIIAPAGLTVTSLNAIDPRALFETNRAQMNPGAQPISLGKTEFKGIKLHLGDGVEIPVKIVWKDVDLDLALLLPEKPGGGNGRTFTYVNLNEAPEAARLLGDYFLLSRAAEVLQRVVLMRVSTITGIIERPRRRLLVSTDTFPDTVGCPVFDSQGKVLGINVRLMENGLPKASVVFPAADLAAVIAENAPPE